MNLETKIIIYKFTPQVFTLTQNLYSLCLVTQKKAVILQSDNYHHKYDV